MCQLLAFPRSHPYILCISVLKVCSIASNTILNPSLEARHIPKLLCIDQNCITGFFEANIIFLLSHTSVMSSMSVLFIMPRLEVKEAFCKRDTGKVGAIWGGNSASMLFIMMFSKAAPSAHRKINKPYTWIYPSAIVFPICPRKKRKLYILS